MKMVTSPVTIQNKGKINYDGKAYSRPVTWKEPPFLSVLENLNYR